MNKQGFRIGEWMIGQLFPVIPTPDNISTLQVDGKESEALQQVCPQSSKYLQPGDTFNKRLTLCDDNALTAYFTLHEMYAPVPKLRAKLDELICRRNKMKDDIAILQDEIQQQYRALGKAEEKLKWREEEIKWRTEY